MCLSADHRIPTNSYEFGNIELFSILEKFQSSICCSVEELISVLYTLQEARFTWSEDGMNEW